MTVDFAAPLTVSFLCSFSYGELLCSEKWKIASAIMKESSLNEVQKVLA